MGRFLSYIEWHVVAGGLLPESRFATSTLRNFVPSGAAHEAAAGHAPAEPSGNQIAICRQKSYSRFNYNFVSCQQNP